MSGLGYRARCVRDDDGSIHPSPPMTLGDGVIDIRYGVAPSRVTGARDRWAPVLEVNGRRSIPWRALERDAALREARDLADDERRRYAGDWTITVARLPDAAMAELAREVGR